MNKYIVALLCLAFLSLSPKEKPTSSSEQTVKTYLARIDLALKKEDYKKVVALQKEALTISLAAGLPKYAILLCTDIAELYTAYLSQPGEAKAYLRQAMAIQKQYKDTSVRRKFMIDYTTAQTYASLSVLDSAHYYFNACAYAIHTFPDSLRSFHSYVSNYYEERAYLALTTYSYQEAVALSQQAIYHYKIKSRTGEGSGNIYNILGKCYVATGDYKNAQQSFRKAAAKYADKPSYQAIVLCNLTDAYVRQGKAKEAQLALQQARQAYQIYFRKSQYPDVDVVRRLNQNQANLLLLEGKLAQALTAYQHLLAFCHTHFPMPSPFRTDAYLSLSTLYQRQNDQQAVRRALDNAVSEAYGPQVRSLEQAALSQSLLKALIAKATYLTTAPAATPAFARANKLEALSAYEAAIGLAGSLRRGALLPESKAFLAKQTASLYTPAIELCYELAQQPNTALSFRQRAFALIDGQQNNLLADAQIEQRLIKDYLPAPFQKEWQQLNHQLAQLRLTREASQSPVVEAELQKVSKALIEWQQRVAHDFPTYTKTLQKISRLSMTDYQQQLTSDELLLCYAPTTTGLLVLTLNRNGSAFKRINVSPATLNRAINVYKDEISRDPKIVGAYDNRPARALYRLLLAPIQEQLKQTTALTIVQPASWGIPFEPLENSNDRILLKDFDIAYQFNLSGRLLPADTSPAQHPALAMAPFGADTGRGPFRMPSGYWLRPLRASAQEATLPGGLRRIGKAATKQRFLTDAPNSQLLLLTTHTYPGKRETALVFHPNSKTENEYLLYPSELQQVDMRAVELAALSACATEKGILLPGDGVHSLGRACAWAGAQSVTVSWFPIHDSAQALINRHFFPRLQQGQSVRQALRQARLDFLDSDEGRRFSGHPYYYAGIGVYGGNNSLTRSTPWWSTWAVVLFVIVVGSAVWMLFKQTAPSTKVLF